MTIFLYTSNCQKTITRTLKNILNVDYDKLIIIDDMSEDNTVPRIIETIGTRFMEEEKYIFHINLKKCGFEESCKKAEKLGCDIIYIDNKISKKELDRRIKCYK